MSHLHLIFGFLGSGKTTLVRHLLASMDSRKKTAVIVNEFGQMGFDGDLIVQGQHVDLVELSSGCICCTLKGSLLNAAEELTRDVGAERIIVEATGVADPDDMLDDFEDPAVVKDFRIAPIVTVVDVHAFAKLRTMLGEYYESQLVTADVILLNKIDLADRDVIESVTREIRALNPDAQFHFTERGDADPGAVLLDGVYGLAPSHGEDDRHHHHGHEGMNSLIVNPKCGLTKSEFEKLCVQLPENLFRIKGYMEIDGSPAQVQYASGQVETLDAERPERYRLVVIGRDLDERQIADTIGEVVATSSE